MKRCPTCNSAYTDEQLSYCLNDGARLVSENQFAAQPTLVAPKFNLPPPVASPQPAHQETARPIYPVVLILMLAAGIIIGLLVAYILLRPTTAPAANQDSAQKVTEPSPQPSTARKATTKETPAQASKNGASQDIRWFVILGTFPASDWDAANERLRTMQAEGFNAYVVETNKYSNFTPDKLAVVLGPFSESEARREASRVHTITPTIKPGW